jgi:uncharacterized protein YndB with AHSA1/START domain
MGRLLNLAVFSAVGLGTVTGASAAEIMQVVTTTAPPAKVWDIIKAFDSIATWLPPAKSSPADHGTDIGSVRVITLKAPGDPTVTEKLTAHSDAARSYSYEIIKVDPKVLPVTNYASTIAVSPTSGGSLVTWRGSFTPAAGVDQATAEKAVAGVYRAGLDEIKVLAEK